MVEVLVKVAVIGGGITGAAIAYDLALRGFKVTLFERGSIASGTSGRTHGLLHSGCRYVRDVEVARRCYIENMILRKIAPWLFEKNGGLFIGITEEDLAYKDFFLSQCEKAGIPVREISVKEAFKLEPNLNPNTKTAVIVPDSSFEALRVVLSFLASAKKRGAEVRPFHEVIGFNIRSGEITSIKVKDWVTLKEKEFKVDFVVNATGPWAAKVSSLAGVKVPVKPSPGVMVALRERVSTMVINRLNPPSDGDIIVSLRNTSVIGTTSWITEDPDRLKAPKSHVKLLLKRGEEMIPLVGKVGVKAVFVAARPLVFEEEAKTGREVKREFKVIDHEKEGVYNMVSVIGGKFTTARYMAEKTVDLVSEKIGVETECRTASFPLVHYYHYFD